MNILKDNSNENLSIGVFHIYNNIWSLHKIKSNKIQRNLNLIKLETKKNQNQIKIDLNNEMTFFGQIPETTPEKNFQTLQYI